MRQVERWQFLAREPADIRRVAPRFEITAYRTTQKIDQYVVISHSPLVASDHTLIHAQHLTGFDRQSCFFAGFTDHGFAQSFTAFEDATWQRPLAQQRRLSAADQQDAMILADHRAPAHQRSLRAFTLHALSFARPPVTLPLISPPLPPFHPSP